MAFFDNLSYGSQKYLDSTKDFLSSNNLVAQIVFLILVIIIFVILVRLGTTILSFFLAPKPDPILINGMTNAKHLKQLTQDPKKSGSIPILRSKDQYNGIEFTWAVWIFIDDPTYEQYRYKHVFNKGNSNVDGDGIVNPNNGPGLYISPVNYPNMAELTLLVRMNVYTNENDPSLLTQVNQACMDAVHAQKNAPNTNPADPQELIALCKKEYQLLNSDVKDTAIAPGIYDDVEIGDIPPNKWISVIIRCSDNNILDIYINGRLTKRHKLSGVARQNYGDVNVTLNGGFSGNLSNLRYYNYAIGTFEIDNIVSNGPNLNQEGKTDLTAAKPYYLAHQWYFDETDNVYAPSLNK